MTSNILQDNELPFEAATQNQVIIQESSQSPVIKGPSNPEHRRLMLIYYDLLTTADRFFPRHGNDLAELGSLNESFEIQFSQIPKDLLLDLAKRKNSSIKYLLENTDLGEIFPDVINLDLNNEYYQKLLLSIFEINQIKNSYKNHFVLSYQFLAYCMHERVTFQNYLSFLKSKNMEGTNTPFYVIDQSNCKVIDTSFRIQQLANIEAFVKETNTSNIRSMLLELDSIETSLKEKITSIKDAPDKTAVMTDLKKYVFDLLKVNSGVF